MRARLCVRDAVDGHSSSKQIYVQRSVTDDSGFTENNWGYLCFNCDEAI